MVVIMTGENMREFIYLFIQGQDLCGPGCSGTHRALAAASRVIKGIKQHTWPKKFNFIYNLPVSSFKICDNWSFIIRKILATNYFYLTLKLEGVDWKCGSVVEIKEFLF